MMYEKLVDRINDSSQYGKEKGYHEEFETIDKNPLKEINAWTYWQGIGVRKPKVLILGQDWGSSEAAAKYFRAIDEMLASGVEEQDKVFSMKKVPGILTNSRDFKTDENLAKCLERIKDKGVSVYPDVLGTKYSDLFFTNLIPGYRRDKKNTGGFKASWVTEQVGEDLKDLLIILRPQVVVCLGKNTFERAVKIYERENPLKNKGWNEYLDSDFEPIEVGLDSESKGSTFLYPMPHPGYFGVKNRKEGKMYADWDRLSEWLERLHFNETEILS